jgi:hypothetical protein
MVGGVENARFSPATIRAAVSFGKYATSCTGNALESLTDSVICITSMAADR